MFVYAFECLNAVTMERYKYEEDAVLYSVFTPAEMALEIDRLLYIVRHFRSAHFTFVRLTNKQTI